MKLIAITIAEKLVRMRFANDPDPAKATEWLEFQTHCQEFEDSWVLAGVQREALDRIRAVIDSEIQGLRSTLNRVRG
jgi:hypothetical protein